ncbi:kunitz-type protease inhibitor 2 isoform X2 [Epinephelus fuscoguttatus]|uniref:kunitz-type protease inhibitor 2 isoform X2 n=1 Tax=Epinephelus fuscoguttatus TaxID=293821 RepID=UPI0020D05FC2|nr:kunitz-type protease inhibitor 2 isoform X2 [Epinephelus fuscoguttatus]
MIRWSLLLLLVCPGLSLDCEWDLAPDPGQSPELDSTVPPVTMAVDRQNCLETCCEDPDCDLALVGVREQQCGMVKCSIQDQDVCVFPPSSGLKVYRKRVKNEDDTEDQEGGEEPRVDPPELRTPRNNQTNNVRCRLPMKVGRCRAAFPKFYYDVTNGSCRSFTYGGCDANGNNFDTREQCEAACSGVTGSVLPDESTAAPELPAKASRLGLALHTEMSATDFAERCEAEPEVGPCRAAFQHWYYNRKTGSCQPFIYGGCRGNKNNYITKESCMTTCTVTVLPSSKKVAADDDDEVSTEYKDACTVTSDPGPCRAAFPMFYFDSQTSTCQSFIYGGCRGNKNRYGTMEECMSRCSRDGSFDTHGKVRDRWTPAVFLFVTLASISALLLVTLVVITLRRRSLSRRPSSVSDKEELLPQPDEQSSLESLTVPETPKPDKA